MTQVTPVITLKQDFDPDKLPMVKLQQTYDDDKKKKMEIPAIDGRSVEATLYGGLNEFYEAAEDLNFNTSWRRAFLLFPPYLMRYNQGRLGQCRY